MSVSVTLIVKNEERPLARCLDSIAGRVDEIVVVDTGSIDAMKEIARRYTEHVFDFTWRDDFSAAYLDQLFRSRLHRRPGTYRLVSRH